MILKPSSVSRVAAELAWTDAMMLASDHAPEPREIALRPVDVDAAEKAIGIGVIDALEVEGIAQEIPMRRLVSDDDSAGRDARPGELYAAHLAPEYFGQNAPVALTQCHDAATSLRAMRPQAPIDAVGPSIGRPNMAADIGSVDLNGLV